MTDAEVAALSALINGATAAQAVVLSHICDKGLLNKADLIAHLEATYERYRTDMKDPRNALAIQQLARMLKGEIPLLN